VKSHRLLSNAVAECRCTGAPWIFLTASTNEHAMSTSLPKAFWLGGQERARRVWQGVSIDYTACGKWLRALASYNKVPKQLVVQKMECNSLDQEQSYWFLFLRCELFEQLIVGGTSNCSVLLLAFQ